MFEILFIFQSVTLYGLDCDTQETIETLVVIGKTCCVIINWLDNIICFVFNLILAMPCLYFLVLYIIMQ